MTRTCFCLAVASMLVLGAVTSLVDGQDTSSSDRERRAPSGFLGMRGKKGSDYLLHPEDDYPMIDPIAARIEAAKSLPLRGKKAPSGFLGMRGKKSEEETSGNALNDYELEALMKRAPSGFLGMRGKKAPSGFLGMRGKKAPSGFLGMRGKKLYEDDAEFDALVEALNAMAEEQQQQKRAPSGFLGMRGKKALYDEAADDELASLYKRAPSGFLGMRG